MRPGGALWRAVPRHDWSGRVALVQLAAVWGLAGAGGSLAVAESSTSGAHWPQFRGPGCRGVAADDERLPDRWSLADDVPGRENVEWFVEIPGRGWSSPIAWGDRVYLTTAVAADELESPKPGLYFGGNRPTPPDTTIRWLVLCQDAATGAQLWQREVASGPAPSGIHRKNSFASETPVTDGRRVWACFGNVGLFCLDATTGDVIWEQRLKPLFTRFGWGPAASPALHDGRLYLVRDSEDGSVLTAYDTENGAQCWEVRREEGSNWSSPYVWVNDLRTEIVTPGSGKTRAYDLDGNLLYELEGASSITIATPYEANGLLFLSSGYVLSPRKPLWALRPGGGGNITLAKGQTTNEAIAWSRPDIAPYNPTTLVYDGLLYVLGDRGMLACYDAATGEEIYSRKRLPEGQAFTASPWAYNGMVFCANEYGETFVVRAGKEFELLHVNPLGEDDMIMASPAIAGGRLLLRSSRGLYALRRPD
jgi:outer membrane protein assembly factor BamB